MILQLLFINSNLCGAEWFSATYSLVYCIARNFCGTKFVFCKLFTNKFLRMAACYNYCYISVKVLNSIAWNA